MLSLVLSFFVVTSQIDFKSFHVIGDVASRGRYPAHTDRIEAAVIGETLDVSDDTDDFQWELAEANDDGVLEHDALRGGYAYATINAENAGPAVLFGSRSLNGLRQWRATYG